MKLQTAVPASQTRGGNKVLNFLLSFILVLGLMPTLILAGTQEAYADNTATQLAFTDGVATIESGGVYQLTADATGTVKVNTTEAVTIVGKGAMWDATGTMTSTPNEQLYIDCSNQAGVNLTLKDAYISNNSPSANSIAFAGAGNKLVFDGAVVIDHNGNASGYAGIYVPADAELTILGTSGSSMYMYKREQAAGIGANDGGASGDITFGVQGGANDFFFFMKGSKQGAVIGNGASCSGQPGDITFLSGVYNMEANARGALIGGSAGVESAAAGNVYVKGGLLNLFVDFSGAAIGGGGYDGGNDKEGGNAYLLGGSVRTYITQNAVSQWPVEAAGVNDVAITANKMNAEGEPVYLMAIDTAGIDAVDGTWTVAVDGDSVYSGPRYSWDFNKTASGTVANWVASSSETNLYVYATGENHAVTVNGVEYTATWDEATGAFMLTESVSGWDGSPDTTWYDAENPKDEYVITTAAQLAGLAQLVDEGNDFAGKSIMLGNDIALNEEGKTDNIWNPIGGAAENAALTIGSQEELTAAINEHGLIYDNMGNSYKVGSDKNFTYVESYSYYYVTGQIFSGTFDGGSNSITGLNVNVATGYAGLFGNVNGTVRDLTVFGTVTSTASNDFVGGIAGKLSEGGTISGVTSNVTVTAENCYNVGGIVGFNGTKTAMTSAENTVIENCVNNGAVTGYSQVGGIAGENAGVIKACANTGKVDGKKTGSKNGCGGIAGRNGCNNAVDSKGAIVDCYNTGTIGNSQMKWVGGIAGFSNGASIIKNCYNVGTCLGQGQTNPLVGQGEASTSYEGAGVYNSWYLDSTKVWDESGVYGGVQVNCGAKTEDDMKSSEFAMLLNADRETGVWNMDAAGDDAINGGYPVFTWQGGNAPEFEPEVLLGDANGDGAIDYGDLQCLFQHISTDNKLVGDALEAGDVNGDDAIDYGDLQALYVLIGA